MIFIFTEGRLGNQIFQYMFAKYICKEREKIYTINLEYFDIIKENNNQFKKISLKKGLSFITNMLNKIFLTLGKLRIITYIIPIYKYIDGYRLETKNYKTKKGLFKNVTYIKGYFINEGEHLIGQNININRKYIEKGKEIISKLPNESYKIFVHIRRGDYLDWSVMGKNNLALPLEFYKKQIKFYQNKYKKISFIFLSDDIKYVKKEFNYMKNAYFSNNNLGIDFAIMTLCDGAIISPSTLSFLGAYFMNRKIEIFAPKYWLGFKIKIRYPKGLKINKFNYININ